MNNIAGGFAGGGASNSARKRYIGTVLSVELMEAIDKLARMPTFTFIEKVAEGIGPHQDDLVVMLLTTSGYQVGCVLVDGGSSTNVTF